MCGVLMQLYPTKGLNYASSLTFRNSSSLNSEKEKQKYDHDTLLKNTPQTNMRIAFDKFTNAATVYTAKGLTGNKNSNFYEFLTLGSIPYIIGSLTLMSVFNSANKHFTAFAKNKASKIGNKMALGVLFYALGKEIAKPLITKPVKMLTGVDADLPYARVIYELPENKSDTDIVSTEYHKVFESVEFPRWDLLYGDEAKGEKHNQYYDKVAKKLGYGENLNSSDAEMKPKIKEIATKSIAVKNIVPYLWGALGVAIAMQKPWDNFFKVATLKFWKGSEFIESAEAFKICLKDSIKQMYRGGANANRTHKIAGRVALFTPIITTVLGVINIVSGAKNKAHNKQVIDNKKAYITD